MKKLLLALLIPLFLLSCKDNTEEATPNCGCNSEVKRTINLSGKLFYKNDSNGNNFNNHKYWIVSSETNCGNCIHSFVICNENILNSISNIPTLNSVNDIIRSMNELNSALDVTFTGEMKTICNPFTTPADYTYDNITLTQIQKQ